MGLWDDAADAEAEAEADAGIGADAIGEEADEAVLIDEAQFVD
jgi:hypothetical protein